jgi:photosystem II stability/assembly factor-like uncharacterized protein
VKRTLTLAALALVATALPVHAEPTPAWTGTLPVEQQTLTQLTAAPDRSGVVLGWVNGTAWRSRDAGLTWTPLLAGPLPGGASYSELRAATATVAWGKNGSTLSRSTNAGDTWQRVAMPDVTRSKFEYIGGLDTTARGATVIGTREGAEINDGCPAPITTLPVLATYDGGRHWRRTDLPVPDETWAVRIAPDGRHVALLAWEMRWSQPERDGSSCSVEGTANSTAVWVSADAGRTWKRTFRCATACFSMAWAGSGRLVVGTARGDVYVGDGGGRKFRSAGRVWPSFVPEVELLQAIGFADAKRGWASVNGVGIFRTDNGGTEWTLEQSPQGAYQLAIGDLTVVDRERAVSGGPWVVASRVMTPAGSVGPAARASSAGGMLAGVPGGWIGTDGVLHRTLRVRDGVPVAGVR